MTDKKNNSKSCKCPFCDAELEIKDMPFCTACKLEVDFKICKNCGKPIPAEVSICPECGQS